MAQEAFELWDELIELNLTEAVTNGNIKLNFVAGQGSYTTPDLQHDTFTYEFTGATISFDFTWSRAQ